MNILILTAHFRPNIGGVETHLDDLCEALLKRGFNVSVLTYRPLQTKTKWNMLEMKKNLWIMRIPWIPNFFYKLVKFPILEFIYLLPGLFFLTPLILISRKINVVHAHGLVAGFVGVFWGKIFNKRVIISTHSIYSFPKKGVYSKFISWIFNNADYNLGLSVQAKEEIKSLGISHRKVDNFTYWIDLNQFKRVNNAKIKLGWNNDFVVLFVGRLVLEKGIITLLESARTWNKNITLYIIGSGPLEREVNNFSHRSKNVKFVGSITQNQLPTFYSASDILIVPSISEEGFGRVILEAMACGTPIIGSNRGAISEAMDNTVGRLIDVNIQNIRNAVEYFYNHKAELKKISNNCRNFTERRYSEKNVEKIIKYYTG